MAHYLAVDWDATELRLVLATSQRGSIRILKAESAPLEFDESTDGAKNVDFGLTLKQLVKSHKIPNASLLLGLNRASVDMMTFRLPKSKPEDLPDLVKNQALRDSPGFTETSPIDFITTPASDGDFLRAIAATVSKTQLKQYRGICQAAGFRAKRIEFRPLALAELYRSSIAGGSHGVPPQSSADKPVLLVQCTISEVDMVVVEETNVAFVRSIKLPESLSDEERTSRIVSEIARTIAVSRQEVEGAALEKVVIYGNTDEFQSLQERLTDQEIETVVQNPFQLPCVVAPAKANIAGLSVNPGHYASLFGMILSEQSKSPVRIDFLHPREKPQPLNIARFVALFLLLVGVIGFGAYMWNKQQLSQLETQLAGLNTDIEQLSTEYQQLNPKYIQLYNAYSWENQQMIWLDELRDVSLRLPDEQDLVIDQMRFYLGQTYGIIDLLARVRDVGVPQQITAQFNDGYHRVIVNNLQPNRWGGGYPYSCSLRIIATKRNDAGYLQFLTPELWQLSQQLPEFPQPETPQERTAPNASDGLEITPDSGDREQGSGDREQGSWDREQEKPDLPHVFPPEYVPADRQIDQGSGDGEQGTGDGEQGTGDSDPGSDVPEDDASAEQVLEDDASEIERDTEEGGDA
ncbi:MAG: hypothetical protein FWD31_08710 [Planctomycetaceae bacterium]|nr:hypothetical protein [Planctomycetaceae bacterium]